MKKKGTGSAEIWLRDHNYSYFRGDINRGDFIRQCSESTGRTVSTVREMLSRIEKEKGIGIPPNKAKLNQEAQKIIESQGKEIDRLKTALDKVNVSTGNNRLELDIDSNSYAFGLIGDTH